MIIHQVLHLICANVMDVNYQYNLISSPQASLIHQPAVSPPFAVETPTAAYSFHAEACSPFFSETLFLPLYSDSALSLSPVQRMLSIRSKQHIHLLIFAIF